MICVLQIVSLHNDAKIQYRYPVKLEIKRNRRKVTINQRSVLLKTRNIKEDSTELESIPLDTSVPVTEAVERLK